MLNIVFILLSFPNKQKSSESSAMNSTLGSNLSELDRLLLELNAVQHSTPAFPTEGTHRSPHIVLLLCLNSDVTNLDLALLFSWRCPFFFFVCSELMDSKAMANVNVTLFFSNRRDGSSAALLQCHPPDQREWRIGKDCATCHGEAQTQWGSPGNRRCATKCGEPFGRAGKFSALTHVSHNSTEQPEKRCLKCSHQK